jgi:GNAT superfamily N-acetyltransferase
LGQSVIVRQIQPHELDSTVTLFNYYFEEAAEKMPAMADEYDENSIIGTIRRYVIDHQCIWLNSFEGQRPVGFIAGNIGTIPWNDDLVVANLSFIYLLPSHRNMDNFRELYKKFEEWARTISAYKISAGDIGIDIERSQKVYEYLGFEPILLMTKELAK